MLYFGFPKPEIHFIDVTSFMLGSTILVSAYLNRKRITAELEGKTIADERSRRVGERTGFIGYYLDKKGEG
jgi:hypothetical protein